MRMKSRELDAPDARHEEIERRDGETTGVLVVRHLGLDLRAVAVIGHVEREVEATKHGAAVGVEHADLPRVSAFGRRRRLARVDAKREHAALTLRSEAGHVQVDARIRRAGHVAREAAGADRRIPRINRGRSVLARTRTRES